MNTEAIHANSLPPLPADLAIPRDADNEPVFREPWEARVFALVVNAHRDGKFAWQQFQELLVDEIGRTEEAGEPRSYYLNWAMAAERLFEQLDCTTRENVDQRVAELRPDDRTIRMR